MEILTNIGREVLTRGDIAHVALLLWAISSSTLLLKMLRELAAAHRRYNTFVRELSRFNKRMDKTTP